MAPPRPSEALVRLARLVLRIFFQRVEVAGEEQIPAGRPLVLVANHVNGLIDPVLVFGALPVRPSFLAKSTLWKIPVLNRLLDLAGAIPVYRRQDQGVDTARNAETFARCHEALAVGGALALFPEGQSHSEPALQPLKTGAARIVLEAERRFGPLGVQIVPVGLLFDAKGKFRSRALVQVGEPLDPAPEAALYREAAAAGEGDDGPAAEAVRGLTARIDEALHEVTINYSSWDEARLIARAADLFARPELEAPRRRTLEEGFALRRAFLQGARDLQRSQPERIAALAEEVRTYDRLLRAFDLRDDQVAARYLPQPVLRFVLATLLRLLVHLPLAAVGTALNVLPYGIVKLIAWRVKDLPDQHATMKVFPGLAVYPAAWLLEAGLLGWTWGAAWGVLALLLALPSGYAALLFHERRVIFRREARAFLLLRTRGRVAEELRARRERLYREVAALAEEYGRGRG
jgi:1-acyl-sn-glycerol-3-phosphate acyltransferase